MRNYSNVSSRSSVQNYYFFDNQNCKILFHEEILKSVLPTLARAFESPLKNVRDDYSYMHKIAVPSSSGNLSQADIELLIYDHNYHCTPSEVRVLADLLRFYFQQAASSSESASSRSLVFFYVNLNTGRSLAISFFKI